MEHNLGGVVEGDECRAHNKHSICDSSPPHGQSDMVTRSPLEILGPSMVQSPISDTLNVIIAAVRMMAQITHLLVHAIRAYMTMFALSRCLLDSKFPR